MNQIGLFCDMNVQRGPGKVARNLVAGLRRINASFGINELGSRNGCLHSWVRQYRKLPPDSLMGPNLFVVPPEHPEIWSRYNRFVVPSWWVKDHYLMFDIARNSTIYEWSAGIDTDEFAVKKQLRKDCFIYFKMRKDGELEKLRLLLEEMDISYEVLAYGNYSEAQLKKQCSESRFCILLTETESQGIGYMEILATNTPCYVLNKQVWDHQPNVPWCKATSVPYFDDRCGVIDNGEAELISRRLFEDFLGRLEKFTPRDYIMENHALEMSAKKYVNLVLNA